MPRLTASTLKRLAAWSAVAVAGAIWLSACSQQPPPPPPPPNAPRPPDLDGEVELQEVFAFRAVSNSVYLESRERSLMDRVMLGPNLMFESSRSSVAEPNTVGPTDLPPGAPDLPNALGHGISTYFSSRLMRYLIAHGSTLVAPAVTRTWCGALEGCPQATWVERVLMMSRTTPQATGAAAGARDGFPLPTSMLAIRDLGVVFRDVPYFVERVGNQWQVRPKRASDPDTGACRGLRVSIPVAAVSGELISSNGGHVVARVDEARALSLRGVSTRRPIPVTRHEPVYQPHFGPSGLVRYISSWSEVEVACNAINGALDALRQEAGRAMLEVDVSEEIIRTALDPVYRETSARAARRDDPAPVAAASLEPALTSSTPLAPVAPVPTRAVRRPTGRRR